MLLSSLGSIGNAQSLQDACAGSSVRYGVEASLPNSTFIWAVTGGSIITNYNDSIDINWQFDRGNQSISVAEISEFGCIGITVYADVLVKGPVADIGDEEEVCEDDVFTFDGTTSYTGNVTYLWPDGSTQSTYSTGTEGYTWVRITGADLCSDYDSAYLTVNPLPAVSLGNDTTLCGTESMFLDPGFFSSYLWSNGEINPELQVTGDRTIPESIWVEVTDENGCRGTDTIILNVCDAALLFANMPNTITPGEEGSAGDGYNDEWIIPNIDLFPDAILEIYDRWGRLVYRTNNVAGEPWKGETMSGKALPMDAYYFVLDIKVAHVKPVTGYVNLIR
jgi:gliding motility-associated-like protein